jgi:hypothetical protein
MSPSSGSIVGFIETRRPIEKPIGETCLKAKHAIGLSNRHTRFVASFRKTRLVNSRMSRRRSHNDWLLAGAQAGFQEAEDRIGRDNRRSGPKALEPAYCPAEIL